MEGSWPTSPVQAAAPAAVSAVAISISLPGPLCVTVVAAGALVVAVLVAIAVAISMSRAAPLWAIAVLAASPVAPSISFRVGLSFAIPVIPVVAASLVAAASMSSRSARCHASPEH